MTYRVNVLSILARMSDSGELPTADSVLQALWAINP